MEIRELKDVSGFKKWELLYEDVQLVLFEQQAFLPWKQAPLPWRHELLAFDSATCQLPFSIVSWPDTNRVILKYKDGATNVFQLTNGLLEMTAKGNWGMKMYYSRKKEAKPSNEYKP